MQVGVNEMSLLIAYSLHNWLVSQPNDLEGTKQKNYNVCVSALCAKYINFLA